MLPRVQRANRVREIEFNLKHSRQFINRATGSLWNRVIKKAAREDDLPPRISSTETRIMRDGGESVNYSD